MGLYFTAVLLASVALAGGSSTLGVVTDLDPGHITSWRQQWPSLPVELSYTNAQEQSVVVMLRLNVPHSITAGVVEVVFPAGFDVSTAFCMEANCQSQPTIQGQTVILQGVTLVAGKDSTVTLGGIANPSAPGGYGPFGVRTRACAGCQTVDLNLSFASVGITGSVGTMKTVALSAPAGVPITRAANLALDFSFVISKELWRHDTVRITLSKYWTLTNPVCTSKLTTGRTTNNFLANSQATFGCSVTDKASSPDGAQVLYIYGLGSDINFAQVEDNKYVTLGVSGFTAPYYDYPDDFYAWKVETMRCTTRNVLERGNILSGPTVNPTPITAATWKPTWAYPANSIMKDMQMYMDLQFTLPYEVPFGGYIQIITSGATVNTFWGATNCFLKELYRGTDPQRAWVKNTATCTANGAYSILVSGLPELPSGKIFTVRSLVSFQATTGVQISSITSYTADGYPINSGSNLAAQSISIADYLLNVFEIVMTTAGGLTSDSDKNWAGGTDDYSYYLKFRIDPRTEEFSSNTKLNISCPFASAVDDFRIYFPADTNTVFKMRKNADLAVASDFSAATGTDTLTSPTVSSLGTADPATTLNYFEIASPIDLTTTAGQSLVIGIHRQTAGSGMSWPRVATNAATAYECYITAIDTRTTGTKLKIQRAVAQFTIRPRDWTASAKYFCSKSYAGAPVYVSVQPTLFPVSYSTTGVTQFYVEFEFLETMVLAGAFLPRFDSGLDDYSEYPYDLDDPVNSFQQGFEQLFSFQVYSENQRTKLRLTNFEALKTTQTYALVFPIGEQLNAGSTQVTVRSYYVLTADDRVKYVQHETSTALIADLAATVNALNTKDWVFGDYVLNGQTLSQNARLKLRTDVNAASQGSNWLYFILPTGYTLMNPTVKEGNWDIWSAVSTFAQPHYFVSSNRKFKFPSVLVKCTGSACVDSLSDRFVEIAGLKPSLGVPCNYKDTIRVVVTDRSDRSGACLDSSAIDHTLLLGQITIAQFQPLTVTGRGPHSVDLSAKVVFRTQHGGHSDSMILIGVNPEFEFIDGVTSCTVDGLSNYNQTTPVRCQVVGNEVQIDQFADFTAAPTTLITLRVHHFNPPQRDWVDHLHFFTSFLSRTKEGRNIDSAQVTNVDLVTVEPAETQGKSSIHMLETVPMNGGQVAADLHIGFSLPSEIPALAGKIEITSPVQLLYSAGNIQNSCWVSGLTYTACTTDGWKVTLSFTQRLAPATSIEVYLDRAVGSLAPDTYTATGFGVTSYWGSATVDRDFQPDQDKYIDVKRFSHRLKPLSAPAEEVVSVDFEADPTTAGEVSWYTFTISLSGRLLASDQLWILFPQDAFDAYVGPAVVHSADTFALPCRSPQLGSVTCTVDHWTVHVFPGNGVEPQRSISLSVSVFNPPHRRGYALDVAHTTAEGELKAMLRGAAVVIPTAPALNIVVKNITSSSDNVRDPATCRFALYISQTMSATSRLQVQYPREYDLDAGELPCNSTWLDQSPGATVTAAQDWNSASSCSVDSPNLLSLAPPGASTFFDTSRLITFAVDGANPEWGENRVGDLMWDFDKNNLLSQPGYNVWTGHWDLFVYDTAAKAYTSRAYRNLHCGYQGFFTPKMQVSANNYNPALGLNTVRLGAGLQTADLTLSVPSAFASKSLVLTPVVRTPDHGFLTLTSGEDFTFYQTETAISFRVAADSSLVAGTYMVEWMAEESVQQGVAAPRYYPPVKTMITVFAPEQNSIGISLTHTEMIAVGARSVPIRLQLESAPATQLIVNLAFRLEIRGAQLSPSILEFLPGQDVQYFELMLDADFDVQNIDQVVLTFWLGGDDADLYEIPWVKSIDVTGARETTTAPAVVSWSEPQCTRSSCVITPSFSAPGVLYWQLAASGSTKPALRELQAKVNRLSDSVAVEGENETTDRNYLSDFRAAWHTDPDEGESWADFQKRLYRAHIMTAYYGRSIQYTDSTQVAAHWLWAGTKYSLTGYFVDFYGDSSDQLNLEFETAPLPAAASISFALPGHPADFSPYVNSLAEALKVNPGRLFYDVSAVSDAKATTFTLSLVPDRFVDGQDPALLSLSQASLNEVLAAHSLPQVTTLTIVALDAEDSLSVVNSLAVTDAGLTFAKLGFSANGVGEMCCVAFPLNLAHPTPVQAWLGLTASNEYAPRACGSASSDPSTITIHGLLQGTRYMTACALANTYPLWPSLSEEVSAVEAITETQRPLVTQIEEIIPQAGGATIVEDVNGSGGLALLAFSLLAL